MATIHLLHGLPGTGKTTFARRLAADTGAVRLNHDEWMTALYGHNPPAAHFADFHDRILVLIWQMAAEFTQRDIDVILDHGFWTRASRDAARAKARELGATCQLYALVCPPAVADARVLQRSTDLKAGVLDINQAALDLFRTRYEPLEPDEDHLVIDTTKP